jgi:nucleoside-diphosphate-sugar epimerase
VSADDLPKVSKQDAMDWRQDIVIDSSKIRHELGYAEPTSFAFGLGRAVAWEESQPPTADPA